jgi:2-polyprenyl-3-methyl-5-hydroxy-6-metoxy-1,4-benzoquinol methylase
MIYTNPRLSESEVNLRYSASYFFNEYLPIFQAGTGSFSLETAQNHYRLYLDLLAAIYAPGKRLLDIGCGAGFFLKAAACSGWEANGTEISEAAAEYARTITKVHVMQGKLEQLGMPTEKYDVVAMLDLLEHLFEPLNTLREVNRIMKDGALLIISTPDVHSLSRLFLGKAWAVLSPAEHQSYFSAATLSRALRQAGFRLIGLKNLLNFNPDYTHQPGGIRHRFWKACSGRLERPTMMQRIHRREHMDLCLALREPDSAPPQTGAFAVKRRIYRATNTWIRGDVLVALARKTQVSEEGSR